MLISEVAMWAAPAPGLAAARRTFSDAGRTMRSIEEVQSHSEAAAAKKTLRRLSHFVTTDHHHHQHHNHSAPKEHKQPSVGSKRDVWLVSFTDVVIRCQRVGVTKLPLGGEQSIKANKKAVSLSKKERNLYKFLKVDHWKGGEGSGRSSRDEIINGSRGSSGRIVEDPLSESEADQSAEQEEQVDLDSSNEQIGGRSRMRYVSFYILIIFQATLLMRRC